jgi:hypothetical protein
MESTVLPVLEQLGIRLLLSPQAPPVRQAVLAQVLRTPENLVEAKQLLAELDSEKFAVRERASRLLSKGFEVYKDLIRERLQDPATSLETRNRLQKVVSAHADAERVGQVVAAFDLTRDARYLVSLLDHVDAAESPRLIRHLEQVTGQKLGPDPAAWKEWAKKALK